jgi:hypothetical protein
VAVSQVDAFITYEFSQYKYLTLRGGYLFDRRAFEGEAYEDSSSDRLDIDDAPLIELTASLWF